MPNVYVINRGAGHDFSPAEQYGTLTFLSDGPMNKFDIGGMHRRFSDALKDSQPTDYILLTSLTAMCSVACAVFAHLHGRLNLLLYREQVGSGRYVERRIILNDQS